MNSKIATVGTEAKVFKSSKKVNTRRLVIIGLLSAISIMLSMTPLGYIPLGPVQATIMHIPVIIGAILEGPIVGLIIGFIFGMTSLIRALTNPTVVSFVFINPVISVLPRVIMGFAAYYIYTFVYNRTSRVQISALVTGFLGSLINTCGVLGLLYVIYAQRYMEALDKVGDPKLLIGTVALTNGVPEAILAGIIVSSVVVIMKKTKKIG